MQALLGTEQSGDGGGLVLLEGEAGIGKSRILEEVLSVGLPEGGRKGHVVFGRGDAATKSQVWHACAPKSPR